MNGHIDIGKPPHEQKIKFIKWVRSSYPGMGLKSAKDLCERFMDDATATRKRDLDARQAEFARRKMELARQFLEQADVVRAAATLDCELSEESWNPWPIEFSDLQAQYQMEYAYSETHKQLFSATQEEKYTMLPTLVDDEGAPLWNESTPVSKTLTKPKPVVIAEMDPELERLLNEEAEIAKDDTAPSVIWDDVAGQYIKNPNLNPGHPSTGLEGD